MQVVQFGMMYVVMVYNGDVVDVGGVEWEYMFYVFIKRNFVNSEGVSDVGIVFVRNVNVFVVLNMSVVVFGYFKVYVYGVVGFEIWDVFVQRGDLFCFEFCDQIYLIFFYFVCGLVYEVRCCLRILCFYRVCKCVCQRVVVVVCVFFVICDVFEEESDMLMYKMFE